VSRTTPSGAPGLVAHVVRRDRDLDVTLEVGPAECVAVIGPNGAGKSSLVDAVTGLLPLDDGSVSIGGRVVAGTGRVLPVHRRRVGLVAQRADLFPHLDVLANVAFGPRASGMSGREARGAARGALTAVGAAELAHRDPETLSGGQAQRVAIARALATDPAVLLLDEPTSALDLGAREEVRAALRTAITGRPTVLVTHDPVEAMLLADRVVVLEAGRIVEAGTPPEVLARPTSAFGAVFSGLVVVDGRATEDGIVTTDGTVLASAAHAVPPGRTVVAAYHPTAAVVTLADAATSAPASTVPTPAAQAPAASTLTQAGAVSEPDPARVVDALEPRDGLVRVRAGDLVADCTLARVAALGLRPGARIQIVVPRDEVAVYEPRR
jgi:molybdate transport system ATP-binding protein